MSRATFGLRGDTVATMHRDAATTVARGDHHERRDSGASVIESRDVGRPPSRFRVDIVATNVRLGTHAITVARDSAARCSVETEMREPPSRVCLHRESNVCLGKREHREGGDLGCSSIGIPDVGGHDLGNADREKCTPTRNHRAHTLIEQRDADSCDHQKRATAQCDWNSRCREPQSRFRTRHRSTVVLSGRATGSRDAAAERSRATATP
ncbi:hypothetical protein AAG906_001867 [Vitis piasezkii]